MMTSFCKSNQFPTSIQRLDIVFAVVEMTWKQHRFNQFLPCEQSYISNLGRLMVEDLQEVWYEIISRVMCVWHW
jgi:hypothetical protein